VSAGVAEPLPKATAETGERVAWSREEGSAGWHERSPAAPLPLGPLANARTATNSSSASAASAQCVSSATSVAGSVASVSRNATSAPASIR
jgi:hypothetical protein